MNKYERNNERKERQERIGGLADSNGDDDNDMWGIFLTGILISHLTRTRCKAAPSWCSSNVGQGWASLRYCSCCTRKSCPHDGQVGIFCHMPLFPVVILVCGCPRVVRVML